VTASTGNLRHEGGVSPPHPCFANAAAPQRRRMPFTITSTLIPWWSASLSVATAARGGQVELLRTTCTENDSPLGGEVGEEQGLAATLETETFRGFGPDSERTRKLQVRALNC